MQPLYLEGKQPTSIAADGPALAVTRQGEATRLVPLRLLTHILSRGSNIQWSQAALIACAQADVPIFISNGEHHLVAAFRANTTSPSQDWQRFMRFIEDPDGIDGYKIFLQGKKTQIQLDISERWMATPEIRLPGYYRVARIIRSAIRADLEAQLHKQGFRRRVILLSQAGLDLPSDFLKLLEPCVHWVINETWKQDCQQQPIPSEPPKPARKVLLYGYECKADLVRDTIRALIISFLYWLAEADVESITGTGAHYAD